MKNRGINEAGLGGDGGGVASVINVKREARMLNDIFVSSPARTKTCFCCVCLSSCQSVERGERCGEIKGNWAGGVVFWHHGLI